MRLLVTKIAFTLVFYLPLGKEVVDGGEYQSVIGEMVGVKSTWAFADILEVRVFGKMVVRIFMCNDGIWEWEHIYVSARICLF